MTRVRRHRPGLTPHDALFRHVFGDPARAAELLRRFLPRRVTRHIDWASLRPVPTSFVDEALANRRADLVFTVRVGGRPTLLFVLIEHKSGPDRMTVFQVARYALRLQERWLAENPRARLLPAVLPFVLFHGPRAWRGPRRLRDLIDLPPALRDWCGAVPDFTFELVDLHALGARLERGAMAVASKLPLLHLQQVGGRRPTSLLLRRWTRLYRKLLATTGGLPLVKRLVSYVAIVSRDDRRNLKAAYHTIGTTTGRNYMTVADQLRREGKREGKREGRREGKREGRIEMLRVLLEARFGQLSPTVLARLAKATADDLDRWARAVLTARSLEKALA